MSGLAAATPDGSEGHPFPVRAVAIRVAKWIDRLGTVWVEGQLTEIRIRNATAYMVLRDPAADMSLSVSCRAELVRSAPVKITEGTQVVVCGKPQFYTGRGSFSLRLSEIRAVGLGELLERIERLRKLLDAEGLFDPRLKRPLPFLPNLVGLITGRAGAAEHDVTTVAAARWPAVRFAIRNTAVQGPTAVAQIVDALGDLDGNPDVDVIVIARGGGSAEDLLPFSDETLCRAIAACRTPVVSAVGHEPDNPLCDLVADVRAATPTDAAKRVVPDTAAELARVAELRHRGARALRQWVAREHHTLRQLRTRPVLADPMRMITERAAEVHRSLTAARRDINRLVEAESDRVEHLGARLSTLGPAATLARGYAVVQTLDGPATVLRSTSGAPAGTALRIRLADGAIGAVSTGGEDDTR
ncbi:exodeoxyribonuclease VII large subunit [Mycolicibacterium sp.]|uniref:exodeoxyribonuclease VII large subunit n=1 Tax=Mycolicibacterium sp. TaxID=2320850 RepID=UPI001DF317CB|nr:exodeoxyribonuclease VII large subunit [Mycolicibacterium sp.]MCB1291266.1 exodeoxyribonuclease VII large subunit [Mycobacterium sp.]MCB9410883.1 exodeoxyribonuclease VII large subunit [Mycolicibacterium sp.]